MLMARLAHAYWLSELIFALRVAGCIPARCEYLYGQQLVVLGLDVCINDMYVVPIK